MAKSKKPAAKKSATKKPATKKPTKATNKPATKATKKPATKKPATKKPATKPATKKPATKQAEPAREGASLAGRIAKGELRGGALADYAIEVHRRDNPDITGLDAPTVNHTKLGTKQLSPALDRWLRADSELFMLGEPQSFPELVASEFPEYAGFFADVGTHYLTGACVLFEGWGADSRRFLYLGVTDRHGEYPVFTLDTDDTPFLCLNGPVDVWLAQQVGALEEEDTYGHLPKAYEPARTELSKLCFGGYLSHIDGVLSKTLG